MAEFAGLEHIVRENEPLAPYGWLRTGGVARYFAEPTTEDELKSLVVLCKSQGISVKLLGGGSNVLIASEVVDAMVIHLSSAAFTEIHVDGNCVVAKGGAKLVQLLSTAAREGLSGLEALAGIPGTVAGALKTNAGTHNDDIGQWIAACGGADIAAQSADIVLVRPGLESLCQLIALSGSTRRIIRQNLWWAFLYNVLAIPLAAGVFSGLGLTLTPMIAAAIMATSSVLVVLNSLRLGRISLV